MEPHYRVIDFSWKGKVGFLTSLNLYNSCLILLVLPCFLISLHAIWNFNCRTDSYIQQFRLYYLWFHVIKGKAHWWLTLYLALAEVSYSNEACWSCMFMCLLGANAYLIIHLYIFLSLYLCSCLSDEIYEDRLSDWLIGISLCISFSGCAFCHLFFHYFYVFFHLTFFFLLCFVLCCFLLLFFVSSLSFFFVLSSVMVIV